jgi:hypothetical protein
MQGRIDDIAKASRQERMNATRRNSVTIVTAADITLTNETGEESTEVADDQRNLFRNTVLYQMCVGLNAGCDFTSAEVVKVGNILAENCLEIKLADTPGVDLAGIDPEVHVHKGANEHADAWGN